MITTEMIRERLIESIRQTPYPPPPPAPRLGIKQSQISCYVHGKKLPALDTLANLCRILDADANYILCLD